MFLYLLYFLIWFPIMSVFVFVVLLYSERVSLNVCALTLVSVLGFVAFLDLEHVCLIFAVSLLLSLRAGVFFTSHMMNKDIKTWVL